MKKDIIAMVLAGGRVDELSVLTLKRAKAALPMWGIYRIIDFALSNLMNSGIDIVGVLSQYKPYSLIGHIQNGSHWDFIGRGREIRILSPFKGNTDSDWYKGTADAIYQNLNFIDHFECEDVLILSGDHVYSMDYRNILRFHKEREADLTIVFKQIASDEAHRFGIGELDRDQRVIRYEEKPSKPFGTNASLTIYVFKKDVLKNLVIHNAHHGRTFQIYSEIIPYMIENNYRVFGYIFDGYWQYTRTIQEYYRSNFDILKRDRITALESMNIRTNPNYFEYSDPPPAFISNNCRVIKSIISPGVRVSGNIFNSIISPKVIIESKTIIKNSIIFGSTIIKEGCQIMNTIIDKNVIIERDTTIGGDSSSEDIPITIIGKGAHIPPNTIIERGCIIHPDLSEKDFPKKIISAHTELRGSKV